ncbi:RNA polymerase sigma factor [Actinomadura luteofluorescens]|uniref:RNA polymerase sigma factor n=1 Tax=Actinomadura luteofluorescens TaxID=46163 RepID=UPI003645D3B1
MRNTATDWARGARRTVVTDEVAEWASDSEDEPPDVDELDALVRAFRSLPERWQTVLWYTVIEDEPVGQVAELLGMEKGAVSQLAFRAREGLRQAFLVAARGDVRNARSSPPSSPRASAVPAAAQPCPATAP